MLILERARDAKPNINLTGLQLQSKLQLQAKQALALRWAPLSYRCDSKLE